MHKIEHLKCQLEIVLKEKAAVKMALAQPCCFVSVPYYEGYDRFAVWPAPNSVSLYNV